jgi:hypothetical protein
VTLIASANLIELPLQAQWHNATGLNISVLPNGSGSILVTFKQ